MHPHSTCEHCGTAFTPQARSKGRFCSHSCWRAYATAHQFMATCHECGTAFPAKPARVAIGKDRFCSRACYLLSRATVPAAPLADRFWPKVQQGTGCWEWIGGRDDNGYGHISSGRRPAVPLLAHRVSWELTNGPIPDGMGVLHHCDNPACVRPDHLFIGDQADNVRDMDAKGRRRYGAPFSRQQRC